MGLSFVLQSLTGATPLQAFAAGAALCSTSLGTTFTVLGSSGLINSRLGVILTSAAMMDDVVGLVMVQIISNLGGSNSSISAVTVVRPLAVSVAFSLCAPIICFFIVRPITLWLNGKRVRSPTGKLNQLLTKSNTAWIIHTLALIGSIAGSTYAGTSNLFASYIAGACISWWDAEVPHPVLEATVSTSEPVQAEDSSNVDPQSAPGPVIQIRREPSFPGLDTFEKYYKQPLDRILRPFFFVRTVHLHYGTVITDTVRHQSGFPFLSLRCSVALSFGRDWYIPSLWPLARLHAVCGSFASRQCRKHLPKYPIC
jgi:hypothetical protein